jgi:hypothetical protein
MALCTMHPVYFRQYNRIAKEICRVVYECLRGSWLTPAAACWKNSSCCSVTAQAGVRTVSGLPKRSRLAHAFRPEYS